jgi:aspartate/tyrosine/aromatic aminotransferase
MTRVPRAAGARIASTVISRPELFAEWNAEMDTMAGRIKVAPRIG